MTLTLMLDLDGTLLTNSVKDFVPAYMEALATHIASDIELEQFFDALLVSTQLMIQNQDPNCLLVNVFDASFYPRLGISQTDLTPAFSDFFEQVYPSLKYLTESKPEAIELVRNAFERDYRVVIATNPLFPLTAIEQRLDWAGLSSANYPYAIVPGIERVHFAKPNPAYLAELLSLIGWPEGPVIMVGDDLENDIFCGRALGLPTYFVNDTYPSDDIANGAHGSGSLEQLLGWIDSTPPERLKPDYSSPSALLAILRSTPAALRSLYQRISPTAWDQRPLPAEWSPNEILCHLRDVECEVNLPRLEKVIHENNPFIPGQDTDPWAVERHYIQQDGALAMDSFYISRMQMINMLSYLAENDWQRPARHAIFGPTSLQELVSIMAGHDQLHIQQLYSIVNPQIH